jgi:AcrR family transcriptional regulator
VARPRHLTDDELLDRVAAGLCSPTWSLNDAARLAGVHAATLIKRFGSRQGVLVALSHRWIAHLPDAPQREGGLVELRGWVDRAAATPADRDTAVAGVAMLMEDLKDTELSRLLAVGWDKQIGYLSALIAHARDAGDLRRAPAPEAAAQILLDVQLGTTVRAAAYPGLDRHSLLTQLLEGWT